MPRFTCFRLPHHANLFTVLLHSDDMANSWNNGYFSFCCVIVLMLYACFIYHAIPFSSPGISLVPQCQPSPSGFTRRDRSWASTLKLHTIAFVATVKQSLIIKYNFCNYTPVRICTWPFGFTWKEAAVRPVCLAKSRVFIIHHQGQDLNR